MNGIDITLLIAIGGFIVALLSLISNKNKNTKENTQKEVAEAIKTATSNANLNAKLDTIMQNVSEMRIDSRETNNTIKSMSEKLTRVEQKVETHDEIIHKLEKYHQEKS